ncbi:MAG TPA: HepT-like ribonuclease domain-containing protein [Bdellovibrionota bacterium]|nr:HepT-like ribonuclease domain-containing protein [Bdellovibrionota bacterium]
MFEYDLFHKESLFSPSKSLRRIRNDKVSVAQKRRAQYKPIRLITLLRSDAAKNFGMMAQESVLPLDLAEALAPSVGLQNRIVHEYGLLDARNVFAGTEKALQLFPKYTASILGLMKN